MTKDAKPATDNDSPWKELLEYHFRPFLSFVRPKIHDRIDWQKDPESKDAEFQPFAPASKRGRRIADKLVKVWNLRGDERFFHVEVQGRVQKSFPRRVHVYNSRAEDKCDSPVVSIVVLIDDDPTWVPTFYVSNHYGCVRKLRFLTTKLIAYRGREAELRADANPVGMFFLAALEALRTKENVEQRVTAKLALIAALKERKMNDGQRWYRYLDWLLPLPEEANLRVLAAAKKMEGETMPFVTFAERHGMEIGLAKGKAEGRGEGVVLVLAPVLRARFGPDGERFAEGLRDAPTEVVGRIAAAAVTATLEELRAMVAE